MAAKGRPRQVRTSSRRWTPILPGSGQGRQGRICNELCDTGGGPAKSYAGRAVLKGLTFTVEQGEIFALLKG